MWRTHRLVESVDISENRENRENFEQSCCVCVLIRTRPPLPVPFSYHASGQQYFRTHSEPKYLCRVYLSQQSQADSTV